MRLQHPQCLFTQLLACFRLRQPWPTPPTASVPPRLPFLLLSSPRRGLPLRLATVVLGGALRPCSPWGARSYRGLGCCHCPGVTGSKGSPTSSYAPSPFQHIPWACAEQNHAFTSTHVNQTQQGAQSAHAPRRVLGTRCPGEPAPSLGSRPWGVHCPSLNHTQGCRAARTQDALAPEETGCSGSLPMSLLIRKPYHRITGPTS